MDGIINGRAVYFSIPELNWPDGSAECRRNGMQLVTITSAMENLQVVELGKLF